MENMQPNWYVHPTPANYGGSIDFLNWKTIKICASTPPCDAGWNCSRYAFDVKKTPKLLFTHRERWRCDCWGAAKAAIIKSEGHDLCSRILKWCWWRTLLVEQSISISFSARLFHWSENIDPSKRIISHFHSRHKTNIIPSLLKVESRHSHFSTRSFTLSHLEESFHLLSVK